MPWDPLVDYQIMGGFTEHFMSLWRSLKPVICKVHGYAIAGKRCHAVIVTVAVVFFYFYFSCCSFRIHHNRRE